MPKSEKLNLVNRAGGSEPGHKIEKSTDKMLNVLSTLIFESGEQKKGELQKNSI